MTQTLGMVIRQQRDKLKLSRWQLASMANVDASTIFRIETDKSTPSKDTLKSLAQHLKMDLSQVLGTDFSRAVPAEKRRATLRIGMSPAAESVPFVLPASGQTGGELQMASRRAPDLRPVFEASDMGTADTTEYDTATLLRGLLAGQLDCIVFPRTADDRLDEQDLSRAATVLLTFDGARGGQARANTERDPGVVDLLIRRDGVEPPLIRSLWAFLKDVNQNLRAMNAAVVAGETSALSKHYDLAGKNWARHAAELFEVLQRAELVLWPLWFSLLEKKDE